jgi:hypothetical protein
MIAHDHASGIEAGWRRRSRAAAFTRAAVPKADASLVLVQRSKVHELHQPIRDGVLFVVWQLPKCRKCILQCFIPLPYQIDLTM